MIDRQLIRQRLAVVATVAAMVTLLGCLKSPDAELVDLFDVAPGRIVTVAGGSAIPSASLAATTSFRGGYGLAVDADTRALYVADATRHVVYRLSKDSDQVELFVGTGIAGFNGDGRVAAETALHIPAQLAVHRVSGDLYIADSQNHRVRRVPRDGSSVITVAGVGVIGVPDERLPTLVPKEPDLSFAHFSGDGGKATDAELNLPVGIALDGRGNLYIADSGSHRIRVVNQQAEPIVVAGVSIQPGSIRTIAGTGVKGGRGDSGLALRAQFAYPKSIAVTSNGDILVVDSFNHRLRRIDGATGRIVTVSSSPQAARKSKGTAASPSIDGVVAGDNGEVFFSDLFAHAIYRVDEAGQHLVAGVGVPGVASDGEDAGSAALSGPGAMALSRQGTLYFVETGSGRLRQIEGRTIGTRGGGRAETLASGVDEEIAVPSPIAVSPTGDVFIGDALSRSVRRIVAASGAMEVLPIDPRYLGRSANLTFVDAKTLLVADANNNMVLRLVFEPDGPRVERVVGTGSSGTMGDAGPAVEAQLSGPMGLALHPDTGELYISTVEIPAIRKVDRDGIITTVAGTGKEGFAGDGGPALTARFRWPISIAFDSGGNLFVADYFNHRIRKISPDGFISTFAGTGERGYAGDGGPAAEASLNNPNDLAIDSEGNLYFTDANNHRVRRIDADAPHLMSTVAGTGERGFSGDGGSALDARLNVPRGIALGRRALYFTDSLNGRVRAVRLRDLSKEND